MFWDHILLQAVDEQNEHATLHKKKFRAKSCCAHRNLLRNENRTWRDVPLTLFPHTRNFCVRAMEEKTGRAR